MQFTPRVCGGIVEGLPRMIIEVNRGTPAPVRLSIPSNRAAQKRDYNEIDPSSGTDSSNPPRSTGESVANRTADDLMLTRRPRPPTAIRGYRPTTRGAVKPHRTWLEPRYGKIRPSGAIETKL